jgi:AraC-like DNA-binding protein
MIGMNSNERDARREAYAREELAERMAHALPHAGRAEPLPGVHLIRAATTDEAMHAVVQPAFCVIAQGSKVLYLGEGRYQYDPYHYLLTTLNLPIIAQVLQASPSQPYLALRFDLDAALVGSVLVETGQMALRARGDAKAIAVSPLDSSLLDAVLRLIRLLDCPTEARLFLPLLTREIVYRLVMGEQGHRLRQMTIPGGHTHRIAQAVEKIRRQFNQLLPVEELAREVGMSASSFHHYFREVTAMSPLQYQKQLRLQEARRLMLAEQLDAATAGYRVGYEDASHFSREYKRFFGAPPLRDVEQLRETVATS